MGLLPAHGNKLCYNRYMEKFFKKLEELSTLLKAFNASIKTPKPTVGMPTTPKVPGATKIPGMAPNSKKDPKKIAEQLKNAELKPKIKIARNGQWSM